MVWEGHTLRLAVMEHWSGDGRSGPLTVLEDLDAERLAALAAEERSPLR
jgi:hypothetical protein